MKKIFAILLALVVVFGFASCGDEECKSCVDSNFDNKCDNCGKVMEEIQLPPVPIN